MTTALYDWNPAPIAERPPTRSPLAPGRSTRQRGQQLFYELRFAEADELLRKIETLGGPNVHLAVRRLRQVLTLMDQAAQGRPPRRRTHEPNAFLVAIARNLCPREQEISSALKTGKSEKQIAALLGISTHTVHVYVKNVYRRYGVSSRAEFLAMWLSG
jgi:DNA-binding NarL/FixJ family response regulator